MDPLNPYSIIQYTNPVTGTNLGTDQSLVFQAGGGGSVLGEQTTAPQETYVDPYAKWGGQTAYNNLVNNYKSQENGIYSSANANADNAAINQNRGILNYIDSYHSAQQGINEKGNRNELAKIQGTNGVLGMVGRGIQSGGVTLANRNAGDSSGTQAIADAYSKLGQREMANVGNQYELGNRDISLAQQDLAGQLNSYKRNYEFDKQTTINTITQTAADALANLDAQIATADLPGRIALEQAKQRVRNDAVAKLSQYDQQLNSIDASNPASDVNTRRATAQNLASMGTNLGQDAFNYTTQAPLQMQGQQGPAGSNLPIYTLPRGRRQG